MTVSYMKKMAEGEGATFFRMLLRWRGSIYKMVSIEIVIWLILYYFINIIYRVGMSMESRKRFESLVMDFAYWNQTISISFFIGFFVSNVFGRWWTMFAAIPWLNYAAYQTQCLIMSKEDPQTAAQIRKTIMRYCNLAWVFVFKRYAFPVEKRFQVEEDNNAQCQDPITRYRAKLARLNEDPVVKETFGKLITNSEIETLVELAKHETKDLENFQGEIFTEWWLPLHWTVRLVLKSHKKNYVANQRAYLSLLTCYNNLRGLLGTIVIYADSALPLIYSQVAIIGVYSFYLLQLIATQAINPSYTILKLANQTIPHDYSHKIDMVFPIFTILQLIFTLGWFKTALVLLNPFGDDDDDFECNEILDYNLQHSLISGNNRPLLYPEKLREHLGSDGADHNLDAALDKLDSSCSEDEDEDAAVKPQFSGQTYQNPTFHYEEEEIEERPKPPTDQDYHPLYRISLV